MVATLPNQRVGVDFRYRGVFEPVDGLTVREVLVRGVASALVVTVQASVDGLYWLEFDGSGLSVGDDLRFILDFSVDGVAYSGDAQATVTSRTRTPPPPSPVANIVADGANLVFIANSFTGDYDLPTAVEVAIEDALGIGIE